MGVIPDGDLLRFETDGDRYFFHVVAGPKSRYEQQYMHRINYPNLSVGERTESIVALGRIEGRPKGIFINDLSPERHAHLRSVSLTLANVRLLQEHFQRRASETAFCFDHGYLWARGIRPVRHVRAIQEIDFVDEGWETAYLYDAANIRYDFRWEEEWRVRDSLDFGPQSLSFVLTEDSAFGGASLDLKLSPIHQFLESCSPLSVPDGLKGIVDASFEIPFVCSSLITDAPRFLQRFVEENPDRLYEPYFDLVSSHLAGQFDDVAQLEDFARGSYGNPHTALACEVDLNGFQQTFLEYVYVTRLLENPIGHLAEEKDLDSEWSHTRLIDYQDELLSELCGFVAGSLAEIAKKRYWDPHSVRPRIV